jgi:hypothetical protein
MSQRWLAAVLLHCEKGFHRVKGYDAISETIAHIEAELEDQVKLQDAA